MHINKAEPPLHWLQGGRVVDIKLVDRLSIESIDGAKW